ncbi:MAG: hypothetical protein RJA70_626 [Pseudomonadota bacterium]|jgi:hypothetical protein
MRYQRLSRRWVLGGAGASLTLPFLESLPQAGAQSAALKRLVVFYVPNGIHMASWTPATEGPDYALTPILAPLANVRNKVLVVSGLANEPAIPDGPGDHASGTGAFITCAHPNKSETEIVSGISIDQVVAKEIGGSTLFPSLQLGVDAGTSAGGCDSGYSCAYARNISWADPSTPLPKLTNPGTVYDRLFAGLDPTVSAADKVRRSLYQTSLLDYVKGDIETLSPKLGQRDRGKLDEYVTGIRELETRLGGAGLISCDPIARPASDYDFVTHVQLMTDLTVVALQCNLTRVVTFMLGNAATGRSYDFLGVTGGHHELSHHQDNPANLAALETIGTWEVQQLAALLEKMDAVDEGGSSVLDNSAVFFSSEIEDGNSHSHRNMPIVVAGGLGGALDTGRHVAYKNQEPVANLLVSLAAGLDVDAAGFGDSTGPLSGLT